MRRRFWRRSRKLQGSRCDCCVRWKRLRRPRTARKRPPKRKHGLRKDSVPEVRTAMFGEPAGTTIQRCPILRGFLRRVGGSRIAQEDWEGVVPLCDRTAQGLLTFRLK